MTRYKIEIYKNANGNIYETVFIDKVIGLKLMDAAGDKCLFVVLGKNNQPLLAFDYSLLKSFQALPTENRKKQNEKTNLKILQRK